MFTPDTLAAVSYTHLRCRYGFRNPVYWYSWYWYRQKYWSCFTNRPSQCRQESVSYTHLDVYKRQVLYHALHCILSWAPWCLQAYPQLLFLYSPVVPGEQAVSYTHLDVYKRQIISLTEFVFTQLYIFMVEYLIPVSYTHLVLCGIQKSSWHDSPAIYIAESESFSDSTQLSPFITINILSF